MEPLKSYAMKLTVLNFVNAIDNEDDNQVMEIARGLFITLLLEPLFSGKLLESSCFDPYFDKILLHLKQDAKKFFEETIKDLKKTEEKAVFVFGAEIKEKEVRRDED